MSFRGKAVASNMKNSFRGKGMLAETTSAWKANWKGAKKVGDGSYARGAGPYEGEWSGNIRHGSGKQMWDCGPLIGCIYEGEWKHGQTSGEGKFTHLDGSTFSGKVSEFAYTQQPCFPACGSCSALLLWERESMCNVARCLVRDGGDRRGRGKACAMLRDAWCVMVSEQQSHHVLRVHSGSRASCKERG
jgi:hypothetical protein